MRVHRLCYQLFLNPCQRWTIFSSISISKHTPLVILAIICKMLLRGFDLFKSRSGRIIFLPFLNDSVTDLEAKLSASTYAHKWM